MLRLGGEASDPRRYGAKAACNERVVVKPLGASHTSHGHGDVNLDPGGQATGWEIGQKRKWAAMAFPVLAALGPYASLSSSGTSSIYLYRILVLASLLPALQLLATSTAKNVTAVRAYRRLAIAWVIWAPISLVWTPDQEGGIKAVIATSFALLGGMFGLGIAGSTHSGFEALRIGWAAAYIVTALIALWELSTGHHLPSLESFNIALLSPTQYGRYAASTFGNQNDYAGFLLACAPPLAYGAIAAKGRRSRLFNASLMLSWMALLPSTQSRTAVIGGIFAVLVITIWLVRIHGDRLLVPLVGALLGTVLLLAMGVFQGVIYNATSSFAGSALDDFSQRFNLTRFGWDVFTDSALLGHGANSYAVLSRQAGLDTTLQAAGHTNAHNAFIEIAAEYGIVVGIPFVALIISCFFGSRQSSSIISAAERTSFRMSMLLATAALVEGGLVSSSTVRAPWWWMLIAYMAAQSAAISRPAVASSIDAGPRSPGSPGQTDDADKVRA